MDSKDDMQYMDSGRDRSRSRSPPSEDDRDNRDRGDSDRDRDRRRDRTDRRRSERPRSSVSKSSSGGGGGGGGGRRAPAERRIYVSNIPYEYKWQDLKDLFRKDVGEVSYVEMFNDENNRPRGCAIIEFDSNDLVNKAIDVMHRHELKGRKLVVKEDFDTDRDGHGRIMKGGRDNMSRGGGGGGGGGRNDYNSRNLDVGPPSMGGGGMGMGMGMGMGGGGGGGGGAAVGVGGSQNKFGNTYGLSTVFLESLGISGPLVNKVFVANLDYKVDDKQLKDVFRIAGKVTHVEINKDQDGKSRGFGVVQFEHPVEAVQAISMLHNQSYYDRKMSVRMDRVSEKQENQTNKLPAGLRSLGMGLGVNGCALNDVSTINSGMTGGGGMGAGMGGMAAGMGGAMGNAGMGGGMSTGMGMMGAMGNNMGGMDGMANNMGMGNMGGGMGTMGVGGMGGGMAGGMVPGMGGGMAGGMAGGMTGGMGTGMAGGMTGGMGMGTAGMVTPVSSMGSLTGLNSGMASPMNRGGNMGSSSNSISSSTGYGSYSQRGSTGASGRDYNNSNNSSSSGNFTGAQRNIIQIGNLPLDYTWQSLRDLCREFGEIRFAEIRSKGTGTVRFQSDADARRAVEMLDRQRLDGRILDVSHV